MPLQNDLAGMFGQVHQNRGGEGEVGTDTLDLLPGQNAPVILRRSVLMLDNDPLIGLLHYADSPIASILSDHRLRA